MGEDREFKVTVTKQWTTTVRADCEGEAIAKAAEQITADPPNNTTFQPVLVPQPTAGQYL